MPTKVTHTHRNTKWCRKPLTQRQTRNRLVSKLQNVDFRLSFDSNDANKNGFSLFLAVFSRLLLCSTYFSNSSYFIRRSGWIFFAFVSSFIFIQTLKFRSIWLCLWHAVSLCLFTLFVYISCTHFWKPKNFLQKHQTKCDRLSNRSERVNMHECVWMYDTKCYLNRQTIYLISTYRIFLTLANVFWGFTK